MRRGHEFTILIIPYIINVSLCGGGYTLELNLIYEYSLYERFVSSATDDIKHR